MRRIARIELLAAALMAAIAATAFGSQAATPGIAAIYVDYSPSCTFSMLVDPGTVLPATATNTPVVTLPPGTYQLLLSMPNPSGGYSPCPKPEFSFVGPGITTAIEFPGAEYHDERLLTLQPLSTYVVQDDGSPALTRRVLATAASGSPDVLVGPPPPSTASGADPSSDYIGSAILRYRGKLAAVVTSAGKATLKQNGHSVGSLKAGKYDFVVDDEDARAGFSVQRGTRKPVAVTTAGYKGKHTLRIALAAGKWKVFAKPGAGVSFTVSA